MKKTVSAHVYNTIERYPKSLKRRKLKKRWETSNVGWHQGLIEVSTTAHLDQTLPIGRILLNLENMDHPKDQPPFSADWTSRIYMFETQLCVFGICFNNLGSKIQHAVRVDFLQFLGP